MTADRSGDVARDKSALLTVAEMGRADALTIAGGISGETLMEAAGRAVAEAVIAHGPSGQVTVLCGPGNNGGDGFVAARILAEQGRTVRLALLGSRAALRGDTALNAERWQGPVEAMTTAVLGDSSCVIDAVFGAGLSRDVEGAAREVLGAIGNRFCVAVDLPSGVRGDSGAILGYAPRADRTVTFFRCKPGHLLYPGRDLCGKTKIADIGIPDAVLDTIAPCQWRNDPVHWRNGFPWPRAKDHKYSRGHAAIAAGGEMTGAAILAATACRRIGAGMVTLASPEQAALVFRVTLPDAVTRVVAGKAAWSRLIVERRVAACLVGPGNGLGARTRHFAVAALDSGLPTVLDADALSVFADHGKDLFSRLREDVVLTPHEGEFQRLFERGSDKLESCRRAAGEAGAVVVLKGTDTVVAAPDGRAVIADTAPPELATAGTGDVLAGMVLGLLAQGMGPFEAACAAVWMHGRAGRIAGIGLVAEDLPALLPQVLTALQARGDETADDFMAAIPLLSRRHKKDRKAEGQ